MIMKKNVILAILCIFCVTAVLFSIAPTKTATMTNSTVTPSSTVSSVNPHDPWVDVNHDGHVNVLDLIIVANSLNTNGDPGLDVTVTNLPTESDTPVWYNTPVNSSMPLDSPTYYDVAGYGHVNFCGEVTDPNGADTITFTVFGQVFNSQHTYYLPVAYYTLKLTNYPNNYITFSIPVPSRYFYVAASSNSATNHHIWLSFFATWA